MDLDLARRARALERLALEKRGEVPYAEDLFSRLASDLLMRAADVHRPDAACSGVLVFDTEPFGRTTLAADLARCLYDDRPAVFRIDDHLGGPRWWRSVLFGPLPYEVLPPGTLVAFLRAHPDGLVLLDDALAYPGEVLRAVADAVDTGEIRDGSGATVDVRATVFVVTARLGAEVAEELSRVGAADAAAFEIEFESVSARHWPDHLLAPTRARFPRRVVDHQRQGLRLLPERRVVPPWSVPLPSVVVDDPQGPRREIVADDRHYDVFLSYKISRHSTTARRIVEGLEAAGLAPWFDRVSVPRRDDETFDRAALVAALRSAVARSRCSVVFEVALDFGSAPKHLGWIDAVDRHLATPAEAGFAAFNWQVVEVEATTRSLVIVDGGRATYEVENGRVTSETRPCAGDDALVRRVVDYVTQWRGGRIQGEPRERPPSTTWIRALLAERPARAVELLERTLGLRADEAELEPVLDLVALHDADPETNRSIVGLLEKHRAAFVAWPSYQRVVTGRLIRSLDDAALRERLLVLAEASLAAEAKSNALSDWLYAAPAEIVRRLVPAMARSTDDGGRIHRLMSILVDHHPGLVEELLPGLLAEGRRISPEHLARGLIEIVVTRGSDDALPPALAPERVLDLGSTDPVLVKTSLGDAALSANLGVSPRELLKQAWNQILGEL